MALRKGPWEIVWGGNTVTDISEIDVEYERDSEDYTTMDHRTYELDGPIKATVTLTLLRSDLPTLAALMPQYFVANGARMSTGETVNNAQGAIDVKAASCDTAPVYGDLDIISCGNPGEVFRLVNARTVIDGVEFDDKVGQVMVRFLGEPAQGEANIQFFKEGTINVVS